MHSEAVQADENGFGTIMVLHTSIALKVARDGLCEGAGLGLVRGDPVMGFPYLGGDHRDVGAGQGCNGSDGAKPSPHHRYGSGRLRSWSDLELKSSEWHVLT